MPVVGTPADVNTTFIHQSIIYLFFTVTDAFHENDPLHKLAEFVLNSPTQQLRHKSWDQAVVWLSRLFTQSCW